MAPGGGKTSVLKAVARQKGLPLINVGLELAQALLDFPANRRFNAVRSQLEKLVVSRGEKLLLLDNLELLFEPSLAHDPLDLLQTLSRQYYLIAAWPGEVQEERLTYAPGHPEYREYRLKNLACEVLIS